MATYTTQKIGTWIDMRTGQGYSGVKRSLYDVPANPKTGQPILSATPITSTTPIIPIQPKIGIVDVLKEVPEATKKVAEGLLDIARELSGIKSAARLTAKVWGMKTFIPTTPLEKAILGIAPIEVPQGKLSIGLEALGVLPFLPMGRIKPVAKIAKEVEPLIKEIEPIQKVISALKEAKLLRKVQETLYTAEKGKKLAQSLAVGEKITGEAGFYAEKGMLKGELLKVEFESIRSKIGQADIDALFIKVKESPLLSEWDKLPAREGLAKLFGEYGGKVPTENEIGLLDKVFGEEFTKVVMGKRSLWEKIKEAGAQLANIPRSIMASFDLSAPLRQGIFFIGRPKQFGSAFVRMFEAFGSEKSFQAIQEGIVRKPTFELMQKSKLSLTEMDRILKTREERFMSNWAEKIPVVGKIVRASGRAYVGFLNKLRADVFDDLIRKATNLGLNPKKNLDLTKEIAGFVNNATGRGSLGGLERAAVGLNSFFFSPRLMMSRLTLLNPLYYVSADPFVRKEAMKSLLSFAGTAMTVMGLAKLGGAEVGADPRSADFAKIKIGNTRIDTLGGFQQYIRLAGQLYSGEIVSSTTGKVMTLGEGYRPLTRLDILERFVEYKEAPIFSFLTGLMKGQDFEGRPMNVPKEVGLRFIPMAAQDIYDIAKDDPRLLPISVLGLFGVGLQTYGQTLTPFKVKDYSKPSLPTGGFKVKNYAK